MELTIAEIIGTISGGLIVISGVVMYLKRLGFNFSKGNGGSNSFTRKEFMSKESKKAIEKLQEDSKLLQTKEMCEVLTGQMTKDISEIKSDIKLILAKV